MYYAGIRKVAERALDVYPMGTRKGMRWRIDEWEGHLTGIRRVLGGY